ncbi:hypothetical protein BASA83_008413 [Batrachochytrium salamandrivorans]|nr:hypothetical protein BASA83_008413 [Batrachochytrium salamandrivorans]
MLSTHRKLDVNTGGDLNTHNHVGIDADFDGEMDLYSSLFDSYHNEASTESNPSTPLHTTAAIAASYGMEGISPIVSAHGPMPGIHTATKEMLMRGQGTQSAISSNHGKGTDRSLFESFSLDLETSFDHFSISSSSLGLHSPTVPRPSVHYMVDNDNDEVFVEEEEEYSDNESNNNDHYAHSSDLHTDSVEPSLVSTNTTADADMGEYTLSSSHAAPPPQAEKVILGKGSIVSDHTAESITRVGLGSNAARSSNTSGRAQHGSYSSHYFHSSSEMDTRQGPRNASSSADDGGGGGGGGGDGAFPVRTLRESGNGDNSNNSRSRSNNNNNNNGSSGGGGGGSSSSSSSNNNNNNNNNNNQSSFGRNNNNRYDGGHLATDQGRSSLSTQSGSNGMQPPLLQLQEQQSPLTPTIHHNQLQPLLLQQQHYHSHPHQQQQQHHQSIQQPGFNRLNDMNSSYPSPHVSNYKHEQLSVDNMLSAQPAALSLPFINSSRGSSIAHSPSLLSTVSTATALSAPPSHPPPPLPHTLSGKVQLQPNTRPAFTATRSSSFGHHAARNGINPAYGKATAASSAAAPLTASSIASSASISASKSLHPPLALRSSSSLSTASLSLPPSMGLPSLPPKSLVSNHDAPSVRASGGMHTPSRDLSLELSTGTSFSDMLYALPESSAPNDGSSGSPPLLSAPSSSAFLHPDSPPASPYASHMTPSGSCMPLTGTASNMSHSSQIQTQFQPHSRAGSQTSDDSFSSASSATAAIRSNFTVRKYHLPAKAKYFASILLELDPATKKALIDAPSANSLTNINIKSALDSHNIQSAPPEQIHSSLPAPFADLQMRSLSVSHTLSHPKPPFVPQLSALSSPPLDIQTGSGAQTISAQAGLEPLPESKGFLEAGQSTRDAYREVIQAKVREQAQARAATVAGNSSGLSSADSRLSNHPGVLSLTPQEEQQSFDYASILAAAEAKAALNQPMTLDADGNYVAANWKSIIPTAVVDHLTARQSLLVLHIPPPPFSQPPPHLLAQQAKFTPAPFVPQRTHRSETLHPRRSSLQSNASIIPSNSPQQQRPPTVKEQQSQSKQRLAALGVFDLEPKARREMIPNPNELSKFNLTSFETPHHVRAQRVGHVGNITGPQLVSTSSRMRTIPIDDIRRDLMASGKWNDDSHDDGSNGSPAGRSHGQYMYPMTQQ